MTEILERVAALETAQKNIYHQIDEVKAEVKDIHSLTVSVEKIAVQMDSTAKKVDQIDSRLGGLEREPGDEFKHYKRLIIGCAVTGVLGAIIGAVMTMILK